MRRLIIIAAAALSRYFATAVARHLAVGSFSLSLSLSLSSQEFAFQKARRV